MRKPFFLNVDVVSRCNLACPSCPQGNTPARLAKVVMTPETLGDILYKAKREAVVFGVGLFNWGEPFTHPALDKMVKVVNDHGLLCYLSSNLNVIPRLAEVLEQEPHSIRISCSGFTQEVYERTHARGDIERVKSNMELLALMKSPRTKVHMLWHQYKHNAHEEYLMREYCEGLGFEFRPTEAYYMPLESVLEVWNGTKPFHAGLMEHKALCANRSMPCRSQEQEITIDAAGRVQLCCGVYDPTKCNLGYFLSTPLGEIQAARFSHSFCDSCIRSGGHVYVTGHSHSGDSVLRHAAKAVYRKIAPLVPVSVLKMVL